MNREVLESQWSQIRDILRDKFSNLTDEDIRQINGRYDQLVAKLQQKYGYSKEEAEERIRSWNFDRHAANNPSGRIVREDEKMRKDDVRRDDVRRDDSSSLLKWILGIGIPLLLALYLFSQMAPSNDVNRTTTSNTPTTSEQVVAETPADRTIANGLRDTLLADRTFAGDIRNIQIRANNGVVTLSGTVPNTETHDFITSTANRFSGVRQVIDNLQVR